MAREVVACCPNCHSTDFKESTIVKQYNHEYPIVYVCDDCGNVFEKWEEIEAIPFVFTNEPIDIAPSLRKPMDPVTWMEKNKDIYGNGTVVSELLEAYAQYRLKLGR